MTAVLGYVHGLIIIVTSSVFSLDADCFVVISYISLHFDEYMVSINNDNYHHYNH